jgi:hypothetical protein
MAFGAQDSQTLELIPKAQDEASATLHEISKHLSAMGTSRAEMARHAREAHAKGEKRLSGTRARSGV